IQIDGVEECDVDAPIDRDGRYRHERLIEISRDDLRRRPRRPAVVGHRAEDPRADERAFLREPEIAERDDGVAGAPRRDVFLVEEIADAAEVAAARGDANRCPRPAAVAGVRNENVGIQRVVRSDEPEAERRIVRTTGGVECDRRIAGRLIRRAEQDGELGPAAAAVERHVRTRVNRFGDAPAWIYSQLVIVRAADDVVLIRRIDRDRRLVVRTFLLAAGVDVRAILDWRRADQISGMKCRTAPEHRPGDRRRSIEYVVRELDRLALLTENRQPSNERERT